MREWLSLGVLTATLFLTGLLAQSTGTLRLASQPAAEVIWQGVSLGLTDEQGFLEIHGIPRGTYSVLLIKNGFLSRAFDVQIVPGQQEQQLKLTPLVSSSAPRDKDPAEDAAPGVDPAPRENLPDSSRPSAPTDPSESSLPSEAETELVPARPAGEPALETPERKPSAPAESRLRPDPKARETGAERRPDSGIRVPSSIPVPGDSDSDLQIVIWWLLAFTAVAGFLYLLTKKHRRDRVIRTEAVAEFTRVLSPRKGKSK